MDWQHYHEEIKAKSFHRQSAILVSSVFYIGKNAVSMLRRHLWAACEDTPPQLVLRTKACHASTDPMLHIEA